VATEKGWTTNFPPSFFAVVGSEILDPGAGIDKKQDPGSGINIRDPQHCFFLNKLSPNSSLWGISNCFFLYKLSQNSSLSGTSN
jgi:hypothetical protein